MGTFRGTFDTIEELEATTGNHHNDYAWVKVTDTDGDNDYDRYKFNGTAWVFEYRLNNTHFSSAELASIRSGMTTEKREKLDNLPATATSTIADTTAAAIISGAKKLFVGTQGQDGRWKLENITVGELGKLVVANATADDTRTPAHIECDDSSGNPFKLTPNALASVLGVWNPNGAREAVKVASTPVEIPGDNPLGIYVLGHPEQLGYTIININQTSIKYIGEQLTNITITKQSHGKVYVSSPSYTGSLFVTQLAF
jgi:hypothetical protein